MNKKMLVLVLPLLVAVTMMFAGSVQGQTQHHLFLYFTHVHPRHILLVRAGVGGIAYMNQSFPANTIIVDVRNVPNNFWLTITYTDGLHTYTGQGQVHYRAPSGCESVIVN